MNPTTARHVIFAGGHALSLINWDPHADFQCGKCHRVFEGMADAREYPCDVVSSDRARGGGKS